MTKKKSIFDSIGDLYNKDTKLESYIKGVSCKYCYNKRSKLQKQRSISRQVQIELAKNKQLKEVIKDINCNISAPKTSLIDSGLAPILGYLD